MLLIAPRYEAVRSLFQLPLHSAHYCYVASQSPKPPPIATNLSQRLPLSFFARPAEQVAPELIGCLLVKRQPTGELLWGVIVETEAYS